MSLLSDVVDAVRSLPDALADAIDRWLMDVHDYEEDWPDEPVPCRWCHEPWPCDEFDRAADRLAERHKASNR